MNTVKFISYDGAYPNLCGGKLVIEINEKRHTLTGSLCSGGRVWFDSDWDEHVEQGEWILGFLPKEIAKYQEQIEEVVNENIPWGCCGGCV